MEERLVGPPPCLTFVPLQMLVRLEEDPGKVSRTHR